MKGWKTWASAIAGFCTGVGMVIAGVMADPIDADMVSKGLMAISLAGATVGIGHKIEKSKANRMVVKLDHLKKLLGK